MHISFILENLLWIAEGLLKQHYNNDINKIYLRCNLLHCFSDTNEDKLLTEKEFVALPPGDVEDEEQKKMDQDWQEDRKKEFREVIDRDHDGVATIKELTVLAQTFSFYNT